MKNIIKEEKDKSIVVLFYPKFGAQEKVDEKTKPFLPLSVLTIGSAVFERGISVLIIDSRVDDENEYKEKLLALKNRLLCIGVSALTIQVLDGAKFSRFVKESLPDVPVVWGGWQVTTFPDDSIKSSCVDIVVKGEGEETFDDLLSHLLERKSLDDVLGINYKVNGEIKINPLRPLENLPANKLYYKELLDLSHYEIIEGKINYRSSRGCPHRCKFCGISNVFHRRWRGKSAKEVVEDILELQEKFNVNYVEMADDNFFVNINRVKEICIGFIANKINIKWGVNGHVSTLIKGNIELFHLLKEAGCRLLITGVESGSQNILEFIQKDIKLDDVIQLTKMMKEVNLPFKTNFMVGFPNETKGDILKTFRFIQKLYEINSEHILILYLYHPIPGTPLYEWEINQEGVKMFYPSNFDEWATYKFDITNNIVTLITAEGCYRLFEKASNFLTDYRDRRYIKVMVFYFWVCCLNKNFKRMKNYSKLKVLYSIFYKLSLYRIKYGFFRVPIEMWAYNFIRKCKRRLLCHN